MSSDEDHNYFSQSRRRLPDYNVDAPPPPAAPAADAFAILPSRHYRQSQQLPRHPSAAATSATPRPSDAFRSSDRTAGSSPDPHDFYRQYRDPARRAGTAIPSDVNGAADRERSVNTAPAAWQPTASTRDRASRLESRFAAPAPSSKPSIPPIQTQRHRQSSLQALVAKFNQSPDEIPPLPTTATTTTTVSPPSSTNPSPLAAATPSRSARRPVPTDRTTRDPPFSSRDALSPNSTAAQRSPGLLDKRKETGKRVPNRPAQGGSSSPAVANHAYGSQSLTDLSPQNNQPSTRRLLFGEITAPLPIETGLRAGGPHVRRGSEGSVQRPDRPASDYEHTSPSSPTAWYKGVTPSLEGIDLSKPVPPRSVRSHRRSQSEIIPGPPSHALHSAMNRPQMNIGSLSPPQEQDTPTSSPQSNRTTPTSRLPISNRRPSASAEEHNPSFATREAALPAPLDLSTPDRATRNMSARKSSENAATDPTRRSPQLAAFISEPPSIRSPPLRSSRPRQPVSTATTYASRARAAATPGRTSQGEKSPKPLPELGGVDLAARRERIQRAFTTKVKAREIETEKKRASLILEARMQKSLHEKPLIPTAEALEEGAQENQATPSQQGTSAKTSEKGRTLTINTGGPDGKRTIKITEEDSPTLGTASFLRPGLLRDDSSDGETSSAASSSTEETYFEQDPSTRGSIPASRNRSDVGLSGAPLHGMDLGDLESIQIMLQETPASERSDGLSDFGSRIQRQNQSNAADAPRGSAPTSSSTAQGPWSPKSNSTLTTAPSRNEGDSHHISHQHSNSYDPYRDDNFGQRDPYNLSSKPLKDASGASAGPPRKNYSQTLQQPAVSHLKRISASLNDPDDWANTSPSMLDWIRHQALDTPIEEHPEQTFPIPGEDGHDSADPSPMLPDIQRTGGLGIDIDRERYKSSPSSANQTPSDVYRDDPSVQHQQLEPKLPANEDPAAKRSSPGLGLGSRQTSQGNEDQTQMTDSRDRTTTDSSSTEPPSVDKSSISITESSKSSLDPSELKRLTRRRNILKELVDTESSFNQDMTVVVDIYKGTSNMILNSAEDVKTLFGNSADIVQFSTAFLDSLKQAVKPVYVLPKAKRWKGRRDSAATSDSAMSDRLSMSGTEMTEDDRDRLTTIGTAFDSNLTQMEKVYTEYLKNHDAANQRLSVLQKSEKVKIWLKECRAYAHDLTTAWDLDSLLVKPVQRILKYPLLLKELIEVTPENHPDFVALDTAAREMVGLSKRINEAKRRADLVGQVNSAAVTVEPPKKRRETEGRLALSKAFGRRTDKMKQQIVTPENVQDRAYNAVADKFGSHFFQLQVVMRDVEMYVTDCQSWVAKLHEFTMAIEAHMDVGQTGYTEIESKWRRFRQSMREMQSTALADHIAAVRKHVIDPMTTLLKLHDGPQRLMDKRKKRIGEYAKYKAIRDRGEKPDKKTAEQGEQFIAVNETLKDELPKLFSLTGKLVEACLQNFVQLQMQWLNVWKAKLRQAIECSQLPESFAVIYDQFSGDFRYTESQVLSLGLCNGSLLADTANFVSFLSPDRSTIGSSTTLNEDSPRRPSYTTDESRSRTTSMTAYDPTRNRGMSTTSTSSLAYQSAEYGRAADGSSLPPPFPAPPLSATVLPPNSGRRVRASSTASRSPATSEGPAAYRQYTNPPTSASYTGRRPSTSTGRSFDSLGMQRTSYDPSSGQYGSSYLHPDSYTGPPTGGSTSGSYRETPSSGSQQQLQPQQQQSPPSQQQQPPPQQQQQQQRQSGVFNSAMPMSDSPREQSPAPGETFDSANLNVLFLAASVYEFNIDRARREAGYPYLTYVAGEIFDVIGEKGELWLAKNQDDSTNQIGWIWNKHFAKLAN